MFAVGSLVGEINEKPCNIGINNHDFKDDHTFGTAPYFRIGARLSGCGRSLPAPGRKTSIAPKIA